jgi:hypothetical protein
MRCLLSAFVRWQAVFINNNRSVSRMCGIKRSPAADRRGMHTYGYTKRSKRPKAGERGIS